jgi:hypothetical protein
MHQLSLIINDILESRDSDCRECMVLGSTTTYAISHFIASVSCAYNVSGCCLSPSEQYLSWNVSVVYVAAILMLSRV